MAEIFRALVFGAEEFTKVVAIKRILPHLSSDHEFVDMFIAEAKLTSQLDHANIVHLFDFGIVEDRLYHAMEYVQGTTVADFIQALQSAKRPAPIPEVCNIIIEALYGLDRAHRQTDQDGNPLSLIHRDLTPSNLLVSWEGQVKIVDFGIAKAASLRHHTAAGTVKGKFRYMSPEQAHGKLLDQRTDLFSLAICFYEMLTLSQLYPEDAGVQGIARAQAAQFALPRQRNPAIPHAIEEILLKALAKNPNERYESAAAMRDALEELMFDVGLRSSNASLAHMMTEMFKGRIQSEQEQIAKEISHSKPIKSDPSATQPAGVKTVVLKEADLPAGWELYPESKPEDTAKVDSDPVAAVPEKPITEKTVLEEPFAEESAPSEIIVVDAVPEPIDLSDSTEDLDPVGPTDEADRTVSRKVIVDLDWQESQATASNPKKPPALTPHLQTVLEAQPLGSRPKPKPAEPVSPLGNNNETLIRGKPLSSDLPEPEDDEDDLDDDDFDDDEIDYSDDDPTNRY